MRRRLLFGHAQRAERLTAIQKAIEERRQELTAQLRELQARVDYGEGIIGPTRTLASEVAGSGITVNAICPGPVATLVNDLRIAYDARRLGRSLEDHERSQTPLGRRLVPAEIAPLAVYLASDESAFINAAVIPIDGGFIP